MAPPERTRRPRRPLALAALAALEIAALGAACRRQPAPPPSPPPPAPPAGPVVDVGALSARVGVKPGGLTTPGVGPEASLMWSEGAVTVRRVGEDRFVDATPKMPLGAGDTIWSGPHTEATIAFADETLVQLAEESVIVIGNRAVAADPASSVALLYGVARVSVSPRARGEGAFLTTAGSALIAAKGTAFAVGVAAGGVVRVGLEHGEVEVAGPRALDKPVTLDAGAATTLDAAGNVGPPEDFKRDDWGEWRFAAEQHLDLSAAARTHSDRLLGEEARLDSDYLVLQKLVTTASALTWKAEANTTPKAAAEYKATALDRGAAIEAAYRLATEIARLTHAALSDAFILGELRARHPKELGDVLAEFTQEIEAAQLYDKKLQLVAAIYLGPLRSAYYAHTATGRARAASLDMPAPAFAQVKLPEVTPAEIAKRASPGLYAPPHIDSMTHPHPLWQHGPKVGWDERLTLQPVTPRQGSWYVAPPQVQPHGIAGVPASAPQAPAFPVVAATETDKADLSFLVPPLPPVGTNAPGAR